MRGRWCRWKHWGREISVRTAERGAAGNTGIWGIRTATDGLVYGQPFAKVEAFVKMLSCPTVIAGQPGAVVCGGRGRSASAALAGICRGRGRRRGLPRGGSGRALLTGRVARGGGFAVARRAAAGDGGRWSSGIARFGRRRPAGQARQRAMVIQQLFYEPGAGDTQRDADRRGAFAELSIQQAGGASAQRQERGFIPGDIFPAGGAVVSHRGDASTEGFRH